MMCNDWQVCDVCGTRFKDKESDICPRCQDELHAQLANIPERELITVTDDTLSILDELYEASAYTITGVKDTDQFMKGYNDWLADLEIGQVDTFYSFTGKQMNKKYNLHGNVAYQPNLHFLAFKLDGLNIPKLAMFKIRMEDRWFDDIVDNNARHLKELII